AKPGIEVLQVVSHHTAEFPTYAIRYVSREPRGGGHRRSASSGKRRSSPRTRRIRRFPASATTSEPSEASAMPAGELNRASDPSANAPPSAGEPLPATIHVAAATAGTRSERPAGAVRRAASVDDSKRSIRTACPRGSVKA